MLVESFGGFLGLNGRFVVECDGVVGDRFRRLSEAANGFPKMFASTGERGAIDVFLPFGLPVVVEDFGDFGI